MIIMRQILPAQGLFMLVALTIAFANPSLAANDIPIPQHKPAIQQKPKTNSSVLNASDIKLYKQIFTLQERGDIETAKQKTAQLKNGVLQGYILQQRYLHPSAYTSSFTELHLWLNKYSDHLDAKQIYELAESKRPKGNNTRLKEPNTRVRIVRRNEPMMREPLQYQSLQTRNASQKASIAAYKKSINTMARNGKYNEALQILQTSAATKGLDHVEIDTLNAKIAAAMLYQGNFKTAYALSSKAARRSGLHVPLAGWVAGLIAWQRQDYDEAARYFEVVGRSQYASSWTRSAGAYWAARSHMRDGNVRDVSIWLERAAASKRTFYGLIAMRALGRDFDFNWDLPEFNDQHRKTLLSNTRGKRAMAWVALGDIGKAQDELLRINVRKSPRLTQAILAYAAHAQLPALSMRLGANPKNAQNGKAQDAALYPLGPWEPKSGFKVKPALVYAIIRQESRFDPNAESFSGAKGLMQLMPSTARYVSDFNNPHVHDPEVNLELGQRYLKKLLTSPSVDGNLLSLLIAYNAGPGNLNKWQQQWKTVNDPLLFIELLPSTETRAYVERVLSNYWIYRMRSNEKTPTLDAVVAGVPVKFEG